VRTKQRYNGWTNYATWNVFLWIGNDEGLHRLACDITRKNRKAPYAELVKTLESMGVEKTGDGVRYDSRLVSRREVNNALREMIA
jgi:hypothetical protein